MNPLLPKWLREYAHEVEQEVDLSIACEFLIQFAQEAADVIDQLESDLCIARTNANFYEECLRVAQGKLP